MRNRVKEFTTSGYWLVPLLWLVAIFAYSSYFGRNYSPDSYYYMMLGKSLMSGHGYVTNVIRENITGASFYARCFPPVMPILYGMTDAIFKTGVASGMLVDLLALYGMLHICYLIGMRMNSRLFYLLPVVCGMLVMSNGGFYDELIAGRAIPVSAFLFLLFLYLVTGRETLPSSCYAMLGVILGIMYLTRYDALLFSVTLPLFLYMARIARLKDVGIMYLGLLLVVSPWAIRNVVTFGHPFVSSNWGAVGALYDTDSPTVVFFRDNMASGVDQPVLWLKQRLSWLCRDLWVICSSIIPAGVFSILCGIVILCLNICGLGSSRGQSMDKRFISIAVFWLLTDVVTVAATKLPDIRYFAVVELLLPLGAVITIIRFISLRNESAMQVKTPNTLGAVVFACLLLGGVVLSISHTILKDDKKDMLIAAYEAFNPYIEPGKMVACAVYADDFGYYTHWNMIYFPPNVTSPQDTQFIAWKEGFHVNYLIVMDQSEFLHYPVKILARSGPFLLIDIRE